MERQVSEPSNRQLAQRARQERERLQRPRTVPRFFPGLAPTRRQLGQLQRAQSQRDFIPSEFVPDDPIEDAQFEEEFQEGPYENPLPREEFASSSLGINIEPWPPLRWL